MRFAFVGFDPRRFCDSLYISLGIKNNFQPCAVTDSKLRVFKRSFGAASAGDNFQDFQAVIAG